MTPVARLVLGIDTAARLGSIALAEDGVATAWATLQPGEHSSGISLSTPLGSGFRSAANLDFRKRLDGQSYGLLSARLSHRVGHAEVFVDAANLGNATYHEIAGVTMPGRWVMAGITLR